MPEKLQYFDGRKSFNVPDPWNSEIGWTSLMGDLEDPQQQQLYRSVAAVFRAVRLTAEATAQIPFAVVTESGEDVDTSDDWQNKVGFMPSPRELIRLWRTSLFMANEAYGFKESKGRTITKLRYLTPGSIEPKAGDDGLLGFYRSLGNRRTFYSIDDRAFPLFYVFLLDYDTELLPSANTEFTALMQSAGTLYWADYFVKDYFQRGGINPSMLMVKGVQRQPEIERMETIWARLRRSLYKFPGKVFNAESIEVHDLGSGIDSLKDSGVYNNAIRNICYASGIPVSLMLNEAANFATAEVYTSFWYNYTIVPIASAIADALTEQVFAPLGYRFEFRPEQAQPSQDEEIKRADAFKIYVDSGVLPSLAARMVGIDMPAGFDYEDLDDDDEPEPEPVQPIPPQLVAPVDEAPAPVTLSYSQFKELDVWRGIASRKAQRGEPLSFDFDVRTLPGVIADSVRASLSSSVTPGDVDAIFDGITSAIVRVETVKRDDDSALLHLADAINRATAGAPSAKADPVEPRQVFNFDVNLPPHAEQPVTVNLPEMRAGDTIVNVPEQAQASVVVQVEPTPVTIENSVTVQPADVILPSGPKSAKVKRDSRGAITGIETVE